MEVSCGRGSGFLAGSWHVGLAVVALLLAPDVPAFLPADTTSSAGIWSARSANLGSVAAKARNVLANFLRNLLCFDFDQLFFLALADLCFLCTLSLLFVVLLLLPLP